MISGLSDQGCQSIIFLIITPKISINKCGFLKYNDSSKSYDDSNGSNNSQFFNTHNILRLMMRGNESIITMLNKLYLFINESVNFNILIHDIFKLFTADWCLWNI